MKRLICIFLLFADHTLSAQTKIITVDAEGWAANSINVSVFRKNALVSIKDSQYVAFYNKDAFVVLGKRKRGSANWQIKQTTYRGNTTDAHRSISIMVDGDGYLHLAWDHHNNKLNYCKSISPGSLELTDKLTMTNLNENKVTYPEFYKMPDGNLLFFFRDGSSGNGNLVINKYDIHSKKWIQLQSNLIDGEKKRNAYWQACVDSKGTIHISWVWRESADVASNHDLCYAASKDGGISWEKSIGEKYVLPINAATAEYICRIPQKSELINQTSMDADENGNPFIASYWREQDNSIPQYHVVFKTNGTWQTQNLAFRKTAFSLSGMGTKRIPVSRPQIVVWGKNKTTAAAVIFRDEERGNVVSVSVNRNMRKSKWTVKDIVNIPVGSWEPTYDTELWKDKKRLNLFVQFANQQDNEGSSTTAAQPVQVLECSFIKE
jgi:BNR repeat-containing family member